MHVLPQNKPLLQLSADPRPSTTSLGRPFTTPTLQNRMTQQANPTDPTGSSLSSLSNLLSSLSTLDFFPANPTRTLSECKVPGAWPVEEEPTLNIPGGWVDCNDEDWCQHISCWIETALGYDCFCERDEVVEIVLSGLKL
jgi:hypothetical protein